MAEAFPVRSGAVTGVPDIHEKISEITGRGGVVLLSTASGKVNYITEAKPVRTWWASPGTIVAFLARLAPL